MGPEAQARRVDDRNVHERIVLSIGLSRKEFEELVEAALASLPPRFSKMVDNVVIAVEEEPSDEDLEACDEDDELLGIYRGVALTERDGDVPLLPDEIAIFRNPILRVTSTRTEAITEIRETVIHELGHYFGLDDDAMPY